MIDFEPPPPTEAAAAAATAAPTSPAAAATASEVPAADADADPAEVDISQHFYAPKATGRQANVPPAGPGSEPQLSEAALRQMMLGFDSAGTPSQGGGQPGNPLAGGPGGDDDPIMKMMSQMMGGGGPGASPFPGMGGMGGMPGFPPQAQQQKQPDFYTSLWRILHAVVALGLGLYITILTPFSGTKSERDLASVADIAENEREKQMFFWIFATAEACLLTTRFFLDKARAPPEGIVWTVTGFLPEPLKGYSQVVLRYGQIFSTVRSDIFSCMFVLGVCSWWRAF